MSFRYTYAVNTGKPQNLARLQVISALSRCNMPTEVLALNKVHCVPDVGVLFGNHTILAVMLKTFSDDKLLNIPKRISKLVLETSCLNRPVIGSKHIFHTPMNILIHI